jgi:hypothetical protein
VTNSPDATAFTDHRAKQSVARRGKGSENAVKSYLETKRSELGVEFDYERVPDARAAGGRFTPVAGDFRAFYRGKSANVEVKEVDTVDRLPKKNFSRDQIARAYRRMLTGVVTVVLIHHTKVDRWVVMPITVFFNNDLPSWNTAEWPSFSRATDALDYGLKTLYL